MKIERYGKNKSLDRNPGQMVVVSEREALSLIQSLAAQLWHKNANCQRDEFRVVVGGKSEYFSIAVEFPSDHKKG